MRQSWHRLRAKCVLKTTTSPFPANACTPPPPCAQPYCAHLTRIGGLTVVSAFTRTTRPMTTLLLSPACVCHSALRSWSYRRRISTPTCEIYNFIKLKFLMRLLGSRRRSARSALALAHARAPGHGPPLPLPRRPHLLPSTPNIARPCNAHVNLLLPPPFVPFSLPRSSGDLPSAASAIAWNPNVIASGRRTPGYRRAKLARTYIRRRPTWWLLMRKS